MSAKVRNSAALTLVFLLWAVLTGLLLGNLLTVLVVKGGGMDIWILQDAAIAAEERPVRDLLRLATLLTHVCTFALPVIALGAWLYGSHWRRELFLDKLPGSITLTLGVAFLLASFPLAQFLYWWNMQLPLPDSLAQMESSALEMIKAFMVMTDVGELLLNVVTIGLVAAVGEELVFRGVVQPRLSKLFGNELAALWVTALVFSAIHFQFAGFLPRMLLGAVLGYLFYWTRNLWVPIAAHFVFNSMQIVAQYFLKEQMDQLDPQNMEQPHWASAVLPLAALLLLGRILKQRKTPETTE